MSGSNDDKTQNTTLQIKVPTQILKTAPSYKPKSRIQNIHETGIRRFQISNVDTEYHRDSMTTLDKSTSYEPKFAATTRLN